MKNKVLVHPRVWAFCQALPPEPRKRFRSALKGLESESGDIKSLEGRLSGYYRLRVGPYRILFSVEINQGQRILCCHFAEHRSIVYEVLEARENLRAFLE
jgi:mRNA-degrading endonuclease RelE of RelBE toxin-antitoxin system